MDTRSDRDPPHPRPQLKSTPTGSAADSHTAQPARQQLGSSVSRRGFLQTMGISGAAAAAGQTAQMALGAMREDGGPQRLGPNPVPFRLMVNGDRVDVTAEPSVTLLEALRSNLKLIGSKEVCDRAACGACSVLVDGRLVASCMMLAVDAIGKEITTVEGIANNGTLHPIQEAFVRHDAVQCGFCTPGLVVACKALLDRHPQPTPDQMRRGLAGNLCRCGTYTNVFNAVLDASGQAIPSDADTPDTAGDITEETTP